MSGKLTVTSIQSNPLVWNMQALTKGFKLGDWSKLTMFSGRNTGKSTFWDGYWEAMFTSGYDKLEEGKRDIWHITLYTDVAEKIEWLRDTFGEGGRNKKKSWRANWIQLNQHQTGYGRTVSVWLKADAAVLFKLRWYDV